MSVGDIHLRLRPPVARADDDWMEAQARPWRKVKALANEHQCPILCSGDVFDKWNPEPELINFAIRTVPRMFSIPGNHDLPYHDYAQVRRSAYWTLVECGILKDLKPGKMEPVSDWFAVMGFPWGVPLKPWVMGPPIQGFNVALIHRYVWSKNTGFPGADMESHVTKVRNALKGYKLVIAGDNHKSFTGRFDDMTVFNGGGFMRTRTDEQEHRPSVGLIWSDGTITREYLDTSEDVLLKREDVIQSAEKKGGFDEFFQAAKDLGNCTADYIEAVWQAAERRKASEGVRKHLTESLEDKK